MTVDVDDLFDRVEGVMDDQDAMYGAFSMNVPMVRLGIAALEDEVVEALETWRKAREEIATDAVGEHVEELRVVIAQVAAIALRLLRDMG